ncbi:hypothetical protein YB2330_000978 [Saitoella coloradoensis]
MSNRLELLKKDARKEERQIQRLRTKQTGHGNATGSLRKRSLVPGWEEQLRAPTSRRLSTIAFTTRRGSRAGRVSPSSSHGGSRRGSLTPRPPPEPKTEEDQQWEDVPLEKFEHELDLSRQPPMKLPTPPQQEQPKPKPAAVFPLPASTFHVISTNATPSPRPKSKSPEPAPTILPAFKPSPKIQRAREPSTVQNTMRFRTESSAGLQPWDREQQDPSWTSGLGSIGSSLKSFWNRNGGANGAMSAGQEPTITSKTIPAPVPAESLVQTRVEAIEKKRLQQGNETWRNKLMNVPSDILSVPKRQPGHARTASTPRSASAGYKDLDTGATNMRRSISMHLPGTTPEQREVLTAPADPSPKEMVNGRRPSSPPPTFKSKTTPPGPPAAGVVQEMEEGPLVSPLPTARNFSRPTSETSPPPAQRTYSLSEEVDEVLPTQQAPVEEQPSPEPVIQTAKHSEPSRQSFGPSSTFGTSHHPQYIDPVTARQMSFARAPSVVHAPIFGALKHFKQQDARNNSIFGFPKPPQSSEEMPAFNDEVEAPLPTTQVESTGQRLLSITIPSRDQSFSDDDDVSPGSMSPRAVTPPHVSPLVQQSVTVAQRQDLKTPSPPSRTPSLSPTPKGVIQRQPSSNYTVSEEDYSMDADSYHLPPEVSAILSGQVSDSFGTLDVDRMIAQFRQKSPSIAPAKMMVKSPSGNVFVDPFTYVGETQQQEFQPGPPISYSIVSPITVQAPVQFPVTSINKRIRSLVAEDSGYGGDVSPRGSISLQGVQGEPPIQQPQYRLPSVAEEDVFIPPNKKIHRLTSLVDDDEYELHRSTSNKRFGQSVPAPAPEQQQEQQSRPPQTPQQSLNRQPSITSEYSTYSPRATPKPRAMLDYSPAPAPAVAAGYQQYLDSPARYYDKTPSPFGSASFNGGSYSNTAYNDTGSSMGNLSTAAPSIHGQHFENGFTFQTPPRTPSRTSQSSRATFAKGQPSFSYHNAASSAVFDEGYHRGYEAAKRAMLQRLAVPEDSEWMDEGGPDPLQNLYDGASTILAPVPQIRRSSSLYSTQRGMVPEAKQYLTPNPGSSYAPSAAGSLYAPGPLRPYSPLYGKGSISGANPYVHAGSSQASQEYIHRASHSRGRSSPCKTSTSYDHPMAAYNGQSRRSGAPDEMPQQRYDPIALQNAQVATEPYQNQQTQEGEMEKGKKKGLMSRLKLKIKNMSM